MTGKYRGSAHRKCNLKLQIIAEKIKIPVIFHNLKGYDSHFIIERLGDIIKEDPLNISVIASNSEKYMAFYLGKHLAFIDSFQFMSQSLAKLSSNLPDDKYIYTSEAFQGERLALIKGKGVYPYDYMDAVEKFAEKKLPEKRYFYSLLADEDISDKEYRHAQKVWDTFRIENIGQYHDLYLKSDVLLLADVFQNFRETCLTYYGLDPCHYITSPGLAWDVMLKMTKINLDLISDIEMQLFIEKGMRGGISYIAHRYAKANNKYMRKENYNEKEESSYIMYFDANNLYGWAMSQKLPHGNFRWIDCPEYINLDSYDENSAKGPILEVDLEYPEELHHLHHDYPCAPEKISVQKEMLLDYCREILEREKMSVGGVRKLIPTLMKKEKYVLHYRNLQLYLSLGLKLKKINRALEFSQSNWLEKYISFNTKMRSQAKNSFEKDFFKPMNNSVFGKTMENLRKRSNIKLVPDPQEMVKLASRPSYISHKIFHENLVAVNIKPVKIRLIKPSYVGMCILDLSKTLMYDFHYNYIKKKYSDGAQLLFTDTDSLTYHIKTEDAYHDFLGDQELFDNSVYPENSGFYFKENKEVIGKFKDEAAGEPIVEFVGLKSKMYSYLKDNDQNTKTAKGVKKNIKKK